MSRATYPRRAVLEQADASADQSRHLGEVNFRAMLTAAVATGTSIALCMDRLPGDPFGHVQPVLVAAACTWATASTWREARRARRHAAAVRGFAGEQYEWMSLHGRRGNPGIAVPGSPAPGQDKDVRAEHRREDERRRRDGVVATAA